MKELDATFMKRAESLKGQEVIPYGLPGKSILVIDGHDAVLRKTYQAV